MKNSTAKNSELLPNSEILRLDLYRDPYHMSEVSNFSDTLHGMHVDMAITSQRHL